MRLHGNKNLHNKGSNQQSRMKNIQRLETDKGLIHEE